MPVSATSSATRALRSCADAPRNLQAVSDVLRHGHVGKQRVGLEHHADIALLDRHVGHVGVVEQIRPPASGVSRPAMMRSSVVLPQPEGPSSTIVSPRAISSDHRLQRAGAVGERLGAGGDAHRDAMMPLARSFAHPAGFTPRSANICIATSSGMIMTKNTSV